MTRLFIAIALAAGCTAGPTAQYSAADSQSVPKFQAAVAAVGMDVANVETPNSQRAVITIGEIRDGITHIGVHPVDRPDRAVEIEIVVAGIRAGSIHYDRSDFPLNKEFLIAVEGWEWMEARINPAPSNTTWPKGTPMPGSSNSNEPNPDDPSNPQGPGSPGPGNPGI
jgi:hypothetical protein